MKVNEDKPAKLRDYLDEELEKICLLEAKTNHSLITIDEAAEIYKQIQSEVLPSSLYDLDDAQLEDIIKRQDLEQELAVSASTKTAAEVVVCPVCMKANLTEGNFYIFCPNSINNISCSFRLNTSVVKFGLSGLTVRLQRAMGDHSCHHVPEFMFENAAESSYCLIMLCDKCGFMHSIV